jgi:hypothetical protein
MTDRSELVADIAEYRKFLPSEQKTRCSVENKTFFESSDRMRAETAQSKEMDQFCPVKSMQIIRTSITLEVTPTPDPAALTANGAFRSFVLPVIQSKSFLFHG